MSCGSGTNGCLDYGAELEGGTCKSQGVCKTKDDCPTTPKAANTVCTLGDSMVSYCDGEGECVLPTVTCGGECAIGVNTCCYAYNNSTSALTLGCQASCTGTALNAVPTATTPVFCDEHGDCREGLLCAFHGAARTDVKCMAPSAANATDGMNYRTQEVCSSPAMSQRACSNGGACSRTIANFPGWKFCEVP